MDCAPTSLGLRPQIEVGRSVFYAPRLVLRHVARSLKIGHRQLGGNNDSECEASGERYRRICNVHVTPPLSCGGKLPIGRHSSVFTGRHAYLLQLLPNTKLFHTFYNSFLTPNSFTPSPSHTVGKKPQLEKSFFPFFDNAGYIPFTVCSRAKSICSTVSVSNDLHRLKLYTPSVYPTYTLNVHPQKARKRAAWVSSLSPARTSDCALDTS